MTFFIDFSENYIVNWGKDGVPKDIEMLNNFRVVFTVSRISVSKFIVLMNSDEFLRLIKSRLLQL